MDENKLWSLKLLLTQNIFGISLTRGLIKDLNSKYYLSLSELHDNNISEILNDLLTPHYFEQSFTIPGTNDIISITSSMSFSEAILFIRQHLLQSKAGKTEWKRIVNDSGLAEPMLSPKRLERGSFSKNTIESVSFALGLQRHWVDHFLNKPGRYKFAENIRDCVYDWAIENNIKNITFCNIYLYEILKWLLDNKSELKKIQQQIYNLQIKVANEKNFSNSNRYIVQLEASLTELCNLYDLLTTTSKDNIDDLFETVKLGSKIR